MNDKIRVVLGYISLACSILFGAISSDLTSVMGMAVISSIWFASVDNDK